MRASHTRGVGGQASGHRRRPSSPKSGAPAVIKAEASIALPKGDGRARLGTAKGTMPITVRCEQRVHRGATLP